MIFGEIFLIGLLGSMHCIGMCGGFVALYTLRRPEEAPAWLYHLLYNGGRITTYTALGGILGQIGSFASYAGSHRTLPTIVLLAAGSIMVLMGLNIAGIIGKRVALENTGITEATFFRTALHRILSIRTVWGTFLFGLLLGFLPCGLFYPVLIQASTSGGLLEGAASALVFGLGTVPAMFAFGYLVTRIRPHMRAVLYRIAAVLIILLGVQALLRGLAYSGLISHGRFW